MKVKEPSLTEHIFKGGLVIILFSVLASPFGYLIRVIFSRSLTPAEYGLFYAMLSFFSFFVTYNNFGFGNSALFHISKYFSQKKYRETWLTFIYTFAIELFTSGTIVIVILGCSSFLSRYYFKSDLSLSLIPIFSLYFIFECISISLKRLFIGLKRVSLYSSLEPLRFIFTFVCSAFLFLTGHTSLWMFAVIWMASYVFIVVIFLAVLQRFSYLMSWPRWDKNLFLELKEYAWPSFFNNLIHQLNTNTDVLFLTLIKGIETVGVYNVTYPILVLPSLVFSPLTRLFFPMISSLSEEKTGEVRIRYFIEFTLKIIPLFSLYFNVFVFLFAESTLATLFTYKWVPLATIPLRWMAVGYFFFILVSYLGFILDGLNLVKAKVKIASSLALFNIVATPIAIYFQGIIGLTIINAIVQLALVIFFIKLLMKKITFTIPYSLYLRYGLFFGGILTGVLLIGYSPTTLMEFLLTGGIYSSCVLLFSVTQNLVEPTTLEFFKQKLLKVRMNRF